jgi:hypothetical protein
MRCFRLNSYNPDHGQRASNYRPSFPNSKSDELQYHTVPLTYLPPLGLGTWQLPKSKAAKIVKVALEKGYRHFDAGMIYGE